MSKSCPWKRNGAKEQEELDAAQKRTARLREEMARAVPATIPLVCEPIQAGHISILVAELERLRHK